MYGRNVRRSEIIHVRVTEEVKGKLKQLQIVPKKHFWESDKSEADVVQDAIDFLYANSGSVIQNTAVECITKKAPKL